MIDEVPKCDHYIFQESFFTKSAMSIARAAQIDACAVTALNQRIDTRPNIYIMKNSMMPRLFDLFVGGEVSSNKDEVAKIMDSERSSNGSNSFRVLDNDYSIRFEEEARLNYRASPNSVKEFLGRALLNGITVYALGVRDPKP